MLVGSAVQRYWSWKDQQTQTCILGDKLSWHDDPVTQLCGRKSDSWNDTDCGHLVISNQLWG